ncbi:MAG: anti-sigma factor [Vicinamibacterales bacterium]
MMFEDCRGIRPKLGEFIDDELPGAEMLRVTEHLDHCPSCRLEVESLRDLGDTLRTAAFAQEAPEMPGLAAGVVSRDGAERAQSWKSLFARAVEDWHWAIVGAGSVAGTTVSTMLVAAVLWFGPAPVRADSLSTMLNELDAKNTVFVVSPNSESWDQVALRVADGQGRSYQAGPFVMRAAFFPGMTEQEASAALAEAIMRKGRVIGLDEMKAADRERTERLLDDITNFRLYTRQVMLMSSTTVSAKGL